MELYWYLGLLLVITLLMPWINMVRINNLRNEFDLLKRELKNQKNIKAEDSDYSTISPARTTSMEEQLRTYQNANVQSSSMNVFFEDEEGEENDPNIIDSNQEKYVYTKKSLPIDDLGESSYATESEPDSFRFEENIATKLPVWIGAVSLIFAAFFLMKYSLDAGWISPVVRVVIGGIFSCLLLVIGQWFVTRDKIANARRISQGLVGAGLAGLYVCLYASVHLYNLIPTFPGFIGMVFVTAIAVILSLRHGQPIAVFGLLGGLLTPALIGSNDPQSTMLFIYLFILFSGIFIVLVRREWWTLAVVSIIGVNLWSLFWYSTAFVERDAIVLMLFAMSIAAIVVLTTARCLTKNPSGSVHLLNLVAIGGAVFTIIMLEQRIQLNLLDWSMFGMLSVALMWLSYFKPEIYQKALWLKLIGTITLYFVWANNSNVNQAPLVLSALAAVYTVGTAFLMRQVYDPRQWSIMQVVALLSFFIVGYFTINADETIWTILSLTLAAFNIAQAAYFKKAYQNDENIKVGLLGISAFAASVFISLGLSFSLSLEYLPIAMAGQVMATAWVYRLTKLTILNLIACLLTLIFIGMQYEQILLFIKIINASFRGTIPYVNDVLGMPLISLAVPGMLFVSALIIFRSTYTATQVLINLLAMTSILLFITCGYYILGAAFHGNYSDGFLTQASFIERGVLTGLIAFIGVLYFRQTYKVGSIWENWGTYLIILAIFRYVYFDGFLHNPLWKSDQNVGTTLILNGVLLTYGGATFLSLYALLSNKFNQIKDVFKVFGFVSLFGWTSLTVRQIFHGENLTYGVTGSLEIYCYSLIWLLTGVGLLGIGILRGSQSARMASLAFIAPTILKVFLYDAAELEGLYRVFSFLGLGVSLIGLSYFYSRFVFKDLRN